MCLTAQFTKRGYVSHCAVLQRVVLLKLCLRKAQRWEDEASDGDGGEVDCDGWEEMEVDCDWIRWIVMGGD